MENLILYGIMVSLIFLLNFFIKSYISNKSRVFTPDEFTHLGIIRHIKKIKKPPKIFTSFLIDKKHKLSFDYPFLFHYLLSFLPIEWVTKHRKDIVAFIDSFNIILLGIFSYVLTSSVSLSLLVILMYLLIPLTFFETIYFSPRPLGYLLINIIMFLLIVLHFTSYSLYVIIIFLIAIFSASIFFLHKFTTQVLLLCLIPLFLLPTYRAEIVAVLFIGFLILTLFKKYYKKILKEHIGCIKKSYWFCKNMNIKPKVIKELIHTAPLLALLYFFVANPSFFLNNEMIKVLLIWVIILQFFAYITTIIKLLRSIGEGERYINYAAFPLSFLLGYFVSKNFQTFNLIILFLGLLPPILLFLVLFRRKILKNDNKLGDDIYELCAKIKKLPKDNIWVEVEDPPLSTAVMHLAQKNVINCLNISFYGSNPDIFDKLKASPIKTIKEFEIDYILTDRDDFQNKHKKYYKKILSMGKFTVFETKFRGRK